MRRAPDEMAARDEADGRPGGGVRRRFSGWRVFWLALPVAVAAGLISCAEPPQDRILKARSLLSEARDMAGADQWAPAEMASAESAMAAAERELIVQNARLGFRRDYAKATELFRLAAEELEIAKQAAQRAKTDAEKAAREALDAAGSAIGHAQATLMIAPVARHERAAIERIETDLGRAELRLAEVRRLIVAERYKEATTLAEEILDQVSSLIRAARRSARR